MDKKYSELGRKLLINAYEENEGENIVCSPFSFYMLLGIALNAVRGKCQEEIKDVLTDDAEASAVTEYICKLEKNIAQEYDGGKLVFTNYDGSISEVTMLRSDEEDYIEDDFYTGFVKNYKGGKYAFMALLPKKKKAKTFWKRAIEQTDFKAYYDSRSYAEVVARIPEFEIATDMELTGFCQSIGIKSIFNPDADFSGMTTQEPLMVSSVLQKAVIKVDRAGTKAAAVSAMYVVAGCAPDFDNIKYVELDRPFVYAVVDRESGLPVFSGVVNKL